MDPGKRMARGWQIWNLQKVSKIDRRERGGRLEAEEAARLLVDRLPRAMVVRRTAVQASGEVKKLLVQG